MDDCPRYSNPIYPQHKFVNNFFGQMRTQALYRRNVFRMDTEMAQHLMEACLHYKRLGHIASTENVSSVDWSGFGPKKDLKSG